MPSRPASEYRSAPRCRQRPAGVGHVNLHLGGLLRIHALLAQSQVGEFESGITESVAERIKRLGGKVPVARSEAGTVLRIMFSRLQLISASSTVAVMGIVLSTLVILNSSRTRGLTPAAINLIPLRWQLT